MNSTHTTYKKKNHLIYKNPTKVKPTKNFNITIRTSFLAQNSKIVNSILLIFDFTNSRENFICLDIKQKPLNSLSPLFIKSLRILNHCGGPMAVIESITFIFLISWESSEILRHTKHQDFACIPTDSTHSFIPELWIVRS